MKHPQTKLINYANNCCLFLCYLYYLGIIPDTLESVMTYIEQSKAKGFIDDTCTILDAEKLLEFFSGKKFKVEKRLIKSINDIKGTAPVRFDFNGHQHWVLVNNGDIVYNSLEYSNCIAKGSPVTARIITLK